MFYSLYIYLVLVIVCSVTKYTNFRYSNILGTRYFNQIHFKRCMQFGRFIYFGMQFGCYEIFEDFQWFLTKNET